MSGNIETGSVYTIGRQRTYGDRSYIGTLWRVIAQTETVVVILSLEASQRPNDTWHGKRHLLDKREYELTPADDLVSILYPEPFAFKRSSQEPST